MKKPGITFWINELNRNDYLYEVFIRETDKKVVLLVFTRYYDESWIAISKLHLYEPVFFNVPPFKSCVICDVTLLSVSIVFNIIIYYCLIVFQNYFIKIKCALLQWIIAAENKCIILSNTIAVNYYIIIITL